jgi:flavin-dependent dehydrogenase
MGDLMENSTPYSTDVFVVGGGPAGLAAAIAARQRGFDVMLADPNMPGADKACGEGLMPEGVEALGRLGVAIPASEARPFRGIRFIQEGVAAEARFEGSIGLGIRRTTLHRILAERAEECGVRLLWRTPVREVAGETVRLPGGSIRARWICAADGSRSPVRRSIGLEPASPDSPRYASRRHFRVRPWTDCVEVYWRRACQLYMAPVGDEEVCIGMISRKLGDHIDQVLPAFPELATHLVGAQPVSTHRGAMTDTQRLPRVYRDRVALLGDASGMVDAITGYGLSLSFQQAHALAAALEAENLALYQAEHRRIQRRPAVMARLMLLMAGRATLQRRVVQIFADEPGLFERIVGFHVAPASVADYAVDGLRFGWRLVTA